MFAQLFIPGFNVVHVAQLPKLCTRASKSLIRHWFNNWNYWSQICYIRIYTSITFQLLQLVLFRQYFVRTGLWKYHTIVPTIEQVKQKHIVRNLQKKKLPFCLEKISILFYKKKTIIYLDNDVSKVSFEKLNIKAIYRVWKTVLFFYLNKPNWFHNTSFHSCLAVQTSHNRS